MSIELIVFQIDFDFDFFFSKDDYKTEGMGLDSGDQNLELQKESLKRVNFILKELYSGLGLG